MRPLFILPALLAFLVNAPLATAGEATATTVMAPSQAHIGPKGGDTRKGHVPSSDGPRTSLPDTDGAPVAAATTSKPWYIGPKGGDTRKGAFHP